MSGQPPKPIDDLKKERRSLLEPPRAGSRFSLLFGGLLVIVLICIGLTLLNQYGPKFPQTGPAPVAATSYAASLLASDTVGKSGVLYLVLPGDGNRTDISRYDPPAASLVNLTRSAGITEVWPVVSPSGLELTYTGIGANEVADLYVLHLPDGLGQPITIQTNATRLHNGFDVDTSRPPQWSLNGTWLAFLAKQTDKRGNAVELYAVKSDGMGLQTLTNNGNQVIDFAWLSDDEISYVEVRGDGQGTVYQRKVDVPPLALTPTLAPLPIATLQISR